MPRVTETGREQERHERAERERVRAERAARLRAEQRPRFGGATRGAPLEAALEAAISADVARRVRRGELPDRALRTECDRLRPKRGRLAYSCTAVTAEVPVTETSEGGVVGYAYLALADPETGRFAFCKFARSPAEGLYTRPLAPLPRACGG